VKQDLKEKDLTLVGGKKNDLIGKKGKRKPAYIGKIK